MQAIVFIFFSFFFSFQEKKDFKGNILFIGNLLCVTGNFHYSIRMEFRLFRRNGKGA